MESVNFVRSTLEQWRKGNEDNGAPDKAWEDEQYRVYSAVEGLANSANVSITVPRLAGRQTSHNNLVTDSTSQYYKLIVWHPFLDCTLQSTRDKFSSHQLTLLKLVALMPSVIQSYVLVLGRTF